MRLVNLLRQCAELESRIGELYQAFALRWHADLPLASFWSDMASEERQHASVLAAAAAVALENQEQHEAVDPRIFASIRGFVLALTSYPAPTSVDEALGTALELEELELDRVHSELVRLSGLESASADVEGRAAAEAHVEKLLVMIERVATDERLQQRVEAHRRKHEAAPLVSVDAALRAISQRLWGIAERRSGKSARSQSRKTRRSPPKNRGGSESGP